MMTRCPLFALLLCLPLIAWGSGALLFLPYPGALAKGAAAGFALISVAIFLLARTWRRALATFAGLFGAVLAIFFLQQPSNERNWQPDLALLPSATIDGTTITLRNIRNCDYRTETDFTVHHYDKTFDLDALTSLDLYLVDWGLTSIVQTKNG